GKEMIARQVHGNIINIASISGLMFMIQAQSIFNTFPILEKNPIVYIVYLRWIFFLLIMAFSLIILTIKDKNISVENG
ncbi:MAG: hypothetical protein ACFFAO_09325, partial [Candidatus Hermodarchaeota archaeon]